MLNKRYYNINELNSNFYDGVDFLFVGICKEERSLAVPQKVLKNFRGELITIEYDIEFEKYIIYRNCELMTEAPQKEMESKDLIPHFINDLIDIGICTKSVLIDSTSMVHPLLFYFIKVLREENTFKLSNFFITYTEPKKYQQNDSTKTNRKFDLTEKFFKRNSLPGFARIPEQEKAKTLVTIMGFEGNRYSTTYEEVNPAIGKTHAVVGFPSFQPGWQYYVYSENKSVIEQSRVYNSIFRVSACEPFGIYNVLKKIYDNDVKNEIVIAPLGTKPHSIGACMFAIDHKSVQLFYDYPIFGKKIRTEGVGNSYLYNLSLFVNE